MMNSNATVAPAKYTDEEYAKLQKEFDEMQKTLDTKEKAEAWVKQASPEQIARFKELVAIERVKEMFYSLSDEEKELALAEDFTNR